MKKIELPMVQFNECQERLKSTRLGRRFLLHPSFVCAGKLINFARLMMFKNYIEIQIL